MRLEGVPLFLVYNLLLQLDISINNFFNLNQWVGASQVVQR